MKLRTIVSKRQIRVKVRELGARISADHRGKDLCVIAVANGGLIFAADLIRQIKIPLRFDIVSAASYHSGETSSGEVTLRLEPSVRLAGSSVLIVDDVLDTGLSIAKIKELIRAKGASEVKTCVLLRKPVSKRLVNVEAEYCGFDIPDVFALGCGLDSDGYYRNLPRVCEKIQR